MWPSGARCREKLLEKPTREELQIQNAIMRDYIKKLEAAGYANQLTDPELVKAYVKKQYAYQMEAMDVTIEAFRSQKIASLVILCLVILVVVAGVLFAGFQLA